MAKLKVELTVSYEDCVPYFVTHLLSLPTIENISHKIIIKNNKKAEHLEEITSEKNKNLILTTCLLNTTKELRSNGVWFGYMLKCKHNDFEFKGEFKSLDFNTFINRLNSLTLGELYKSKYYNKLKLMLHKIYTERNYE